MTENPSTYNIGMRIYRTRKKVFRNIATTDNSIYYLAPWLPLPPVLLPAVVALPVAAELVAL